MKQFLIVFPKRPSLKMMLLPARGGSEEIPGRKERILFIENYGLIWENRERIINDEALFETRLYFAGLSLAYINGGSLTLGDTPYTLWNNGEWTTGTPSAAVP